MLRFLVGRSGRTMGLSARLLVLTVFFVMVAEFLIYAPSIARFRKDYLDERVTRGHLATLALEATPDNMVSRELERKLLLHARAHAIAYQRPDRRLLALSDRMPPAIDLTIDLRRGNFVTWIGDAFETLAQDDNRVLRIIGKPPKVDGMAVELVIDEEPLREAMYGYSVRILQLSVVISLFTATLVYLSLQWLMVRPMRRITRSMTDFRDNPEDETAALPPSHRGDEIGIAQRELAVMQDEVRSALRQKNRLATLGAAVAKINHDLRNSLSTAMLVSDKLSNSEDPEVQKVTPRLYDAIDRAVNLCSQTMTYVGESGPKLDRQLFHLHELVEEVKAAFRTEQEEGQAATLRNEVSFEVSVQADRDQLFRVLSNLTRNAGQAGAGTVTVRADDGPNGVVIEVADDGPGMPQKARDKLFQPFAGSARQGGTGLGLVIARDIVKAHGGSLDLAETGERGTTFRLTLPAPA